MKTNTLAMIMIILMTSIQCKKPVSGFTADKTEAYIGDVIHFFDNEEIRKNCTFSYDFGDGTNSSDNNNNNYLYGYNGGNNSNSEYSDRNPSHIYLIPGTFEVTQTIAIAGNLEKGKSKQISSKLVIIIKPIEVDFTVSDSIASTSTIVHLKNISNGGRIYMNGFASNWTFSNTTEPGNSSNITTTYIGSNNTIATEAYVRFNSPGVWKISLRYGNSNYYSAQNTKSITVN